MDTGKINRNMTFTFPDLEAIDIWVAEKQLPAEL
jgi:DeoR/GlpR family transcriptional regulator of sugar metabolism